MRGCLDLSASRGAIRNPGWLLALTVAPMRHTLMECQGNEVLTAASTRGGDLGASEPQAPPNPTPMPIHLSAGPGRACSVIRDSSPRTCTTGRSTPGARKGETCLVTGGRYANGGLARLAHPLRLFWLCSPRRVQRPAEGRVKWQPQIR